MIELLIVLLVVGGVLFIVNRLPLDANIKVIIQVVAIIAVCIWLLRTYAGGLG